MEKETTRKIVKDKRKSIPQWINLNRNNSFVNRTRLPSFSESSGAILLVLVGLTASRQADRQAIWQAGNLAGRQTEYT